MLYWQHPSPRFEDWGIGEKVRDIVQQGAGSKGHGAGLFRKDI